MKSAYLVVSILAFGCGGKKDEAPKGEAPKGAIDCESVIPAGVDRMMAELKKNPAAASGKGATLVDETGARLKTALMADCMQTKYSTAYLTCVAAAKTTPELEACDKQLTPEQQKASEKSVGEAMQPLVEWMQAEQAKQAGSN